VHLIWCNLVKIGEMPRPEENPSIEGLPLLTEGSFDASSIPPGMKVFRHAMGRLPANPRCKACQVPFEGIGGRFARTFLGRRPSNYTIHFCNRCEQSLREHPGGVEIELSLLFADVRGSTQLAEKLNPSAFSALIDRFYTTATDILIHTDAIIDKLSGDEVLGVFVPGFAGPNHAGRAIEAAEKLLIETGHTDPNGPWVEVGAGVNTGVAWIGSLGSAGGVTDITVLGDPVNTAARLASQAKVGEIVISDRSWNDAELGARPADTRVLALKGKREGVSVHVLRLK
jgi:adenylate cyclase